MLDPKSPLQAAAIFLGGIGRSRRTRQKAVPALALSKGEAYRLLGADQGCSRAELRAAYMIRIRQLHPDVNPLRDTTEEATALNEAYALLQEGFLTGEEEVPSVFDVPEAEPSELFINPFACNTSPLLWRELQEVVKGADDPVSELAAQGVYIRDSAVYYLTPCQLAAVTADLEAMEDSMAVELTSWLVSDCLMRAARANDRMPAQRRS
ncbi:hypothetical protein COCSUDRAFT_62912 [Coccomyxa subellipsoidea C-169]|uniref:J domain-containing protein n=1 Tax=Coccomyxa subellipsoidea (strain C-169) TaxID=574566 RepID=I0YYA6_COCSC|nr:hypothetical protein COCSUDRAFT_62912 [Coccomyxa subellipsoidea C-169]EIE23375.1 hypothetical protein COCSUDRAFT_62912 [Coccomyxa subellipsoidea C-169]|eukprot:XP_005647919.1 hypothetical protein COCSUDRAFT_62912 [Coccomyxa subellipsoidea C-169]